MGSTDRIEGSVSSWRTFRIVMWLLPCVFFGAWPLLPHWLLMDETASQLAIIAAYGSLLTLLQWKLRTTRCTHCERSSFAARGPRFRAMP